MEASPAPTMMASRPRTELALPSTMKGVYFEEDVKIPAPGQVYEPAPFVTAAPLPELLPGFVMVKIHAASINPVDKYIAAGFFKVLTVTAATP